MWIVVIIIIKMELVVVAVFALFSRVVLFFLSFSHARQHLHNKSDFCSLAAHIFFIAMNKFKLPQIMAFDNAAAHFCRRFFFRCCCRWKIAGFNIAAGFSSNYTMHDQIGYKLKNKSHTF